MKEMTKRFLGDAFAGESQAHMRYLIFSEKAEKEGFTNVARLFKAIAYAEFVHAKNHLMELGGVAETLKNLETAVAGETFEVEEMYPAYHEVAKLQGEAGAQRTTKYALEAEKTHAQLYSKAKEAVSKNQDVDVGPIYICPKCGFTAVDEAPDKCPVCGCPSERFVKF